MKSVFKIVLILSVFCISCELNTDDEEIVSNETECVTPPTVIDVVEPVINEPEPITEPTEPTEPVSEPITEPSEPVINWDSTIERIDALLFEKGVAIYNDAYFRDKKEFRDPEIERSTFYPKINGLVYTSTKVDRFSDNGLNYWYYHYEMEHTTENIQRVCSYLGISQDSVIVWG